ncbi:class I SAM-dependent methyltransferase [Marinobacter sp. TBZ242]|uniref:Class I SAM-dependent methyltransferase n=1 Tax=Marinobacter azerbaijanicus TaxID=3050455 RepID=A0ABT7IIK5_9GAMM|nr:class I SAM-dependent methyltransferase [Marinobacter sp. TBZ242]MDL0434006.1 class I SAM-dependent methyltransferase [Marinobacter sp. TBZ242]
MYDEISELYHLVYEDWEAAIQKQAMALNSLFRDMIGTVPLSLLDVSCGIGTQSLGLAAMGYNVTGSDLSPSAVERARREARQRGLEIDFSIADMRECSAIHSNQFDIVISMDNSIPHLQGVEEVSRALQGFYQCLRPGGIAVIGIRDYHPNEDRKSPQMWPYGFREHGGHRYFVYQTRDWYGDSYRVAMYFIREADRGCDAQVTSGVSTYYAISVDQVMSIFTDIGFDGVRRIDNLAHQPVIVGRRPEA